MKKIKDIKFMFSFDVTEKHANNYNVYDTDGISPCLTADIYKQSALPFIFDKKIDEKE